VSSSTLESLPRWAHSLLEEERVGHLGLVDSSSRPRDLPLTYAIHGAAAWTAGDNTPKRPGRELARIRWLRERPTAALTVDHYDDGWSQLRWVPLIVAR
jgi:nitroimidazol reductase NimA-like FMN-containing flavoprotein (pyridoxamine 5'-phosphate oxidase superfamily)